MHDPCTLAFSFPPYSSKGRHGGLLYRRLKPFIGFDVWHVDPERVGTGNRTDDSCGWFDRSPGPYADAVAYVLKDKETLHEISRSIASRDPVTGPYGHTYPRMSSSETLAACLLVARELETRRWWNGASGNGGAHRSWRRRTFTKRRAVDSIAFDLALNPLDNLSTIDEPETFVRLIAAALNRHFRAWWKHPRWHVHHWRINVDLARNLKRMFQRCHGCKKRLGFGYCPTSIGWGSGGPYYHGECAGIGMSCDRDTLRHAETAGLGAKQG